MLNEWLGALEQRHLADLTFSEVTRALRALSSNYVERRERLGHKTAFDSAGKRAAYALYYSPLHFLTVRLIADRLRLHDSPASHILDLGCGAGAAGAAWASMLARPQVTGVDAHPWAVTEAKFTYRTFGLDATTKRGDAARTLLPRSADAVVAGWAINELGDASRAAVQATLVRAAKSGVQILVVEPIATSVTPWWSDWARTFAELGGRADEWRFPTELPDLLKRLDRAAGLRHDELKARSLYSAARPV